MESFSLALLERVISSHSSMFSITSDQDSGIKWHCSCILL